MYRTVVKCITHDFFCEVILPKQNLEQEVFKVLHLEDSIYWSHKATKGVVNKVCREALKWKQSYQSSLCLCGTPQFKAIETKDVHSKVIFD